MNQDSQSIPENPSGNFVFLYRKTKTCVGTDLFAFFQFGRVWFTKPFVECAALGKIADLTAQANCRQNIYHVVDNSIECFNRTSFFI